MATTSTSTDVHMNRLASAKSPYLLQHASNPVDWYEWGTEAFAKAEREDKMIFLSVGYSSCHWCHVMAHESFESDDIASILNEHFVNIKVDREERPDVDAAYMQFVISISGHGGWPMSVFLTPQGKPLFGGTYFPPDAFPSLLHRLVMLWRQERDRCEASAKDVAEQLQNHSNILANGTGPNAAAALPSLDLVTKAASHWESTFDTTDGGFGSAPKFPTVSQTHHLLHRYSHVLRDPSAAAKLVPNLPPREILLKAESALYMSAFTLVKIARGGIHDHIGKGFARYSVDGRWHVPHFEKMLYDQGQLLSAYCECIQQIKALPDVSSGLRQQLEPFVPELIAAAEGIILYLSRDLQNPRGGAFFSSEDADSYSEHDPPRAKPAKNKVKKEGAFYVYTQQEIEALLGPRSEVAVEVFMHHFSVARDGNVNPANDPHGELVGRNVLQASGSFQDTAQATGMPVGEVRNIIREGVEKLNFWRMHNRPRPGLDDKIITAWNGLAISGLARAAQVLDPSTGQAGDTARQMAQRAVAFIWGNLVDPATGLLHRSYREGRGPRGFSADYAFMVQALLDLYDTTLFPAYLGKALELQRKQDSMFFDEKNGGWLIAMDEPGAHHHKNGYSRNGTPSNGQGTSVTVDDVPAGAKMMLRGKENQDGAEPTSTSVGAHNLLRLLSIFDDEEAVSGMRARLSKALNSGGVFLNAAPYALGTLLTARMHLEGGLTQVIVVGSATDPRTQALLDEARSPMRFMPDRALLYVDPWAEDVQTHPLYRFNTAIRQIVDDMRTRGGDDAEEEEAPHAHVCKGFACGLPLRSVDELANALDGRS